MHQPPFRLAHPGLLGASGATTTFAGPDCCTPDAASRAVPARRRLPLSGFDTRYHCSLIGTCMTTSELRKLVSKFVAIDRQQASDLDIHHEAVTLATAGGDGCKALQKALDDRHALAIRRFAAAKSAEAVQAMWQQAQESADIPGAYWATMTHPASTVALRQAAFGDVHMLSHLVGAANRADIQQLMALEAENAALRDKIDAQQLRLQQASVDKAASLRDAARDIAALRQRVAQLEPSHRDETTHDIAALRAVLAERDEAFALQADRLSAAEQRAQTAQALAEQRDKTLETALAQLAALRAETAAMEAALSSEWEDDSTMRQPAALHLSGQRIVYVGGRPGPTRRLKTLVETAGGTFDAHDGGIEDRKGLLAAMVARADMVVFPVDCIDHDSMHTLKRVCEQHGVRYHPVRTASVASFVELAARLA